MLTKEQIIQAVKSGRESECLDGRDYGRMVDFFDVEDWPVFGFKVSDGADVSGREAKEFTRENILQQLKSDVEFGFEKALNQRGLSSGMMYSVVKMWMWVLEDELQHMDDYAQYGLPLFKQVAEKYGFENPIGPDSGSEHKYSEYA
jgi:hypothetical protein